MLVPKAARKTRQAWNGDTPANYLSVEAGDVALCTYLALSIGNDEARMKDFEKRGYIWVGDVDERSVKGVASMMTPVPGGVGPVTTAL